MIKGHPVDLWWQGHNPEQTLDVAGGRNGRTKWDGSKMPLSKETATTTKKEKKKERKKRLFFFLKKKKAIINMN